MKFFAALFALMAVTSVAAAPAHLPSALQKGAAAIKAGKGSKGSAVGGAAGALAAAKANAASKAAAAASSASTSVDNSTASAVDNSTASAVDNSTASAADNSTASAADNSTASAADNSTAAADASAAADAAASKTRIRDCDMGDQSLAAGLQAMTTIGIGQQAAVVTLQGATAAADFAAGVTRLQQFVDTQGLQLQMAQGIADDGSFAQTQLKLLAASQTQQEAAVKTLVDAQTSAADLATLLTSFLTTTDNAQDGAEQALIDCRIPLNAISG
jgi:asparagine N-glycosylation enzyme membrane subunit Stt3